MKKLDHSLLRPLPPFSKLNPAQIGEILALATPRRFDNGLAVFYEGDPAAHFFLLLDGYIRVVRVTPEGEQIIALHIPSGQLFGIAQALGHHSYPATAVTASECLVLSWPTRFWESFVANYDGFSTETYKTIGKRMEEVQERVVEMATQQVEQRVAHALLRLISQTGRKTDIGIEINFPITRQDISEMTGTTLHTVSRLLSGWEKKGIVLSGRKRITVCDPHKLVVLSEAAV